MTKDEEGEGTSSNSIGTWLAFSFIQSLLSIIRPTKQLPIRASTMNDREEGTNSSIGSKWSEIGDDVLGMILQRLSPIDCLRAQTVCLSWQSTISKLITNKHGPPSPDLPLVLFNMPQMNHFSFFNLSTKSVFSYIADSSTTCQNKIVCCGIVQGWVIMNECFDKFLFRSRVFFFNPVTNTKVYMRPTLRDGYKIKKIVASTKPTDPNCVVVCLFHRPDSFAFSFMSDKSWTLIEDERGAGINFLEAEIFCGKLYALTDVRFNNLVVCDLRTKPVRPQVLAKLPATRRVSVTREVDVRFPFPAVVNRNGSVFKFLAIDASSEELLLVYLFFNLKCSGRSFLVSPPDITRIRVFKLDNIISGKPKWIEVRNLENRMLYVDSTKSIVVSNVDVHGPEELTEGNCIYFAFRFLFERIASIEPWEGIRIGRHCKSNGRTGYYKFERLDSDNISPPIWFIPHLDG